MRHSPIWEREERCIASTSNENYNPLSHDYSKESENYTPLAVPDCFLCSLLQSQNDRLLEINQNLLKSLDNSNREKKEIKKSMTERTPGPLCKIIQKKREEIDSLKTDLQMALRENADLQWRSTTKNDENFEDLRGIIEYLEKRLELSEADSCSKDGDISKLNHKVTHLQSEVDGLRYKLQEEQTKMHWLTVYSEQSRAKFENDKRTPESEIDNLRFEVKILKSENEKLEENRRQSLQEKEKLSVIHSNELKLKEEEMKVLKKDVEKINLELQSLYAKNREYEKNSKNTNQDSEILRLKYEVNDLKEEIHTLKKQADNLRLEKVQIQRKFEFDLKREDSRAASEINRLRQVILQLENQKYETDIASLSRKKGAALQRENEKRKLADQDSPEMQYLKEQVCNLKKEVNMLEKEAKRLHEEKIQDQRKGELGLKERDSQTRIAESEISRLKQVLLQLENENIKHKSHISAISEAKENALHRQSQAELNMKTLTEEMQHMRERLLKQEDNNYRLQKELSEVCKEKDNALTRLSKVAKLTQGNTSITDLKSSDTNRPTKIAEKFSELYDNQWRDAFEELGKTFNNEEETIQVLLTILQEAYTFCLQAENNYETRIGEAVLTLTDIDTKETRRINGTKSSIQKVLTDLRLSMSNACSQVIGKMFLAKLPSILKNIDVSRSPKTKLYASECASLCWRMRVRGPPVFVRFEFSKGTTFNTDILRRYTKTGDYLDFIVWPALYLHENGPVLSKGVAQPRHSP